MELLVCVRDKRNHNDPVKDHLLIKRGDVIAAMPDGFAWSKIERENPDWRILRVQDMTETEAVSYTSGEKPPSERRQYHLRAWAKRIDLDKLGVATTGAEARDDSRLEFRRQDIAAVTAMKTPKPADEIIGPVDDTIGPK